MWEHVFDAISGEIGKYDLELKQNSRVSYLLAIVVLVAYLTYLIYSLFSFACSILCVQVVDMKAWFLETSSHVLSYHEDIH